AHLADDPLAQVEAAVDGLPDGHPAKKPLLRFIKTAEGDREELLTELEGWYDGVMARMTGWYKRRVQWFILGYAIVLTAVFNVDTLSIASNLYRDGGTRQTVAAAAVQQAKGSSPAATDDALRKAQS